MKSIQQIIDEDKTNSKIHSYSEARINVTISNRERGEDEEFRRITSENMKNMWVNDQTQRIKNISDSIADKWNDDDHVLKQKIGRAKRYSTPELCGNFISPIIGTNILTGKEEKYIGAQQLRNAGFDPPNIYACLSGNRKSHKGYTWRREPI